MKTIKKTRLGEWQSRGSFGGVCEKCNREVALLTVDHIVPIKFVMGLDNGKELAYNDEENFRLICQPCNHLKSSNFDFTDHRTATLLYKYIKPYLKI